MKPVSNRYTREELIIPLDHGLLYRGKDLSLQRIVFIYAVPHQGQPYAQTYIHQIGNSAQVTNSAPYMHVFDVEMDQTYIYIIMKYIKGTPLQQFMLNHTFSIQEAAAFVTSMGQTLMEIAEDRPLNFSISPNNLWVSDELQISLINTWDKSQHNQRLSKELSGILYSLVTQTKQVPADTEALRNGLQSSHLLDELSLTQKKTLITTAANAYEERLSALSFTQSLKDLFHEPNEIEGTEEPEDYAVAPRHSHKNKALATLFTTLKHALFRKLVWKRISLTLSLALLSAVVFIGVFAYLIETTGHKESKSTLASSTGNQQQTSPPENKPQQIEIKNAKEPVEAKTENHVVVPVLTGLTREDAEKQALANGLRYSFYIETNALAAGTVFKQEPMPHEEAAKGSRVTFWISKGSAAP
ncbi:PASTA domain-containing protein [Paenibacillus sp. LMG 31456]|uniref:PASTA domain-containing protein n=1 Tax=Paenibacillus foliorum TaxID=2654974 RepID=A0A972GU82_9BACL|nr:PASTA domain-containing protein [Paenibacillus foliorum]NOU96792.1 PASTA domain-containing protein [Paenibacillus foliorum]